MKIAPLFPLALLAGCQAPQTACESLCDTLVMGCDFAAYPTSDSCVEGCLYDQEQGADIEGEAACIEATSCDPIGTVECAREFNPDGG